MDLGRILTRTTAGVRGALHETGSSGCIRLGLRIAAEQIAEELSQLPESAWNSTDRNHYAHRDTRSFWAIGHRRGPVVRHTDEGPALASAPSLRRAVQSQAAFTPRRMVVTQLRPGGLIPLHTDSRLYFRDTIRVALCITSDPGVRILCAGRWYSMRPGEAWILDNLAPHAVVHHGKIPRIHAVIDCEPDAKLVDLIRAGEAEFGGADRRAEFEVAWRSALRKYYYTADQFRRRLRGLPVND